ncbi:MAG: DUF123 domain-containing protein [Gammaproteobacteria bacterium]|nr:MAG: DUF123 domain-containing protein [Gammaproteobacteria bacterium]
MSTGLERRIRARVPAECGCYLLLMRVSRTQRLRVGALGMMRVDPGWLVYVGSACGPGGLRARLARHARRRKPRRWHIDWLRERVALQAVCWQVGWRDEAAWARRLGAMPGASAPLPGFGASDDPGNTHLWHFRERPVLEWAGHCVE